MNSIVLDRDGVINQDSDNYIRSENEWLPIPGSIEAIASLSKAGFSVYVATNQSGLARGLFDEFELAKMHQKLVNLVSDAGGHVEGIVFCPHLPTANCECRKPKTGLLIEIENEFGHSLVDSFFVGDSVKDIEAAKSHGCIPVLVRTGKGVQSEETLLAQGILDFEVFDDLSMASVHILNASDV